MQPRTGPPEGWHGARTCWTGYPLPDPGRGGVAGLAAYAKRLHAAGMTFGTYFESQRSNPVFSNTTSFRGQAVAALPANLRPPPMEQLLKYAKYAYPGIQPALALPGSGVAGLAKMSRAMDLQDGGYNDIIQYFEDAANKTTPRNLHVLFPMHIDADGFWTNYLETWMKQIASAGVDSPYLDQLGYYPRGPDFGPSRFGDGASMQRVWELLKPGSPVSSAYGTAAFAFTYEGYTDLWSHAGGIAMLSGSRLIPCVTMCSPSVPHRCDLCVDEFPWLAEYPQFGDPTGSFNGTARGFVAAWEVVRATFPHHTVIEGLNDIPTVAPIVSRTVGAGYVDGHTADLYAATTGTAFGFLSPLVWMCEAVSPWVHHPMAEYRYTEGVVSCPSDTTVRQHSGKGFAIFLYFSPSSRGGALTLDVSGNNEIVCTITKTCRWFLLEMSVATPLACIGKAQCTASVFGGSTATTSGEYDEFAGAVLVVSGAAQADANLHAMAPALTLPPALTLIKTELVGPSQTRLTLSTCNIGPAAASGAAHVASLESADGFPLHMPYSVPAWQCGNFSTIVDTSKLALPLHLNVTAAAVLDPSKKEVRRLAPVPIADPRFSHRRFASGVIDRPTADAVPPFNGNDDDENESPSTDDDDNNTDAVLLPPPSPFVMRLRGEEQGSVYRNVYWPTG